jgi:hypothetical protein
LSLGAWLFWLIFGVGTASKVQPHLERIYAAALDGLRSRQSTPKRPEHLPAGEGARTATPMKKIKQRKGTVAWMALAAVLLYLGGYGVWMGITHVGPGVWEFGGGEPGTGGALEADTFWDVIPEDEYKLQCYVSAVFSFWIGGLFLWDAIKKWKERNELEKSWELAISNPSNVQEIQRHPESYRDDFRQWIKENHPNLLLQAKPGNPKN